MINPIVTLVLDSTPINGYDTKVNGELIMPDKDLSGNTSNSSTAEEGFKPKKISVSLKIKYVDINDLSALITLSQTLNSSDERKIYTIINQTAKAFNVRQVKFTERLRAAELDDQQAWQVNFTLLEHNSIPEKTEKRQAANNVVEAESGNISQDSTVNSVIENDNAISLSKRSLFEQTLAFSDRRFEPDDETTA